MPRLAPSLLRRAGRISPHLATLLPSCRTIESAQAELRWIRRHVLDRHRARRNAKRQPGLDGGRTQLDAEDRVARLVARRGAGEPLQYVLGSQPFGALEILCEKGVLIPRPETEAWAATLADLVLSPPVRREAEGKGEGGAQGVRVLDLCSGTGCIGLYLYARCMTASSGPGGDIQPGHQDTGEAHPPARVFGFDIEPRAARLARKNLAHNFRRGSRVNSTLDPGRLAVRGAVTFRQADIFTDDWMAYLDGAGCADGDERGQARRVDVLVCNPPYISQRGFDVDTGRSVRNYEPKIALVPARAPSSFPTAPSLAAPRPARTTTCAPEDIFYERLLDVADALRPRVAVFEVGDMKQAIRAVEMAVARSRPLHPLDPVTILKGGGDEARGQRVARWDVLEIWRDWPDCQPSGAEEDVVIVGGRKVPVRGSGHGRAVFLVDGRMMWNRFTNRGFRREVYTGLRFDIQ